MEREVGTVIRFDANLGYGFIRPDTGGRGLFVHHREIQTEGYRTLREGERVEFGIGPDPKGRPEAKSVIPF